MKKTFLETIEKYNMLPDMCPVVVAVSGGADSIALLRLLWDSIENPAQRILAVHVEHGIRGDESKKDAEYVRSYCEKYGINCHVAHIDVISEAMRTGESLEEAARRMRYDILYTEADALGFAARIAVAHHSSDQAETVIMNLARGSHLKGLSGMAPVNGRIVRPLLFCNRADIEEYLRERRIEWCEDLTNRDTNYTRNLVRHKIVPLMSEINDEAMMHIGQTALELAEAEDFLTQKADEYYDKYVCFDGERVRISIKILEPSENVHPEMVKRVLYQSIVKVAGRAKDISRNHVAILQEFFSKQVGRRIELPYEIIATRNYDTIDLCNKLIIRDKFYRKIPKLEAGDTADIEDFHIKLLNAKDLNGIPKNKYTKYFDYDIIKHDLCLRYPEDGDYLVIDSDGHIKSLMDYLKDEKVPRDDRPYTFVLAEDSHILWVVGHRISEKYRVCGDTNRVLEIVYRSIEGEE